MQQQALIFEKFRQGGEATNRPQGTGWDYPSPARLWSTLVDACGWSPVRLTARVFCSFCRITAPSALKIAKNGDKP
jgi:hypothetical protein